VCPFTQAVRSRLRSPIKTGALLTTFVRLAVAGTRIMHMRRRKIRGIRLGIMKSNFKTLMIKIITLY
jgi:hypothetical protein